MMAGSNIDDTLIFLEAHPQLVSKHLNPLLDTVSDIKHLVDSAKQTLMLDFVLVIYCVIIVEKK